MYRHVARFHLNLAQLWRCPVSWCTMWKGTPQDCMDHIRGAHDVPWRLSRPAWRSTSLHGQLRGKCGRIHWRLSTRGFRWMCRCLVTSVLGAPLQDSQARSSSYCFPAELHVPATRSVAIASSPPAVGVVSPDSSSSGSLCPAGSPEVVDRSPRTTR